MLMEPNFSSVSSDNIRETHFDSGVTEKMTELRLEVYDEDTVADDTIGKTTIPLGGILSTGYVDAWYSIGKGSKSTGEVHAMLRFHPGAFPPGFDPNAVTFDDGVKVAAGVAGGALAAAALGYGAKLAYDHYNKKPEQGGVQPQAINQTHGQNNPGYASGGAHQQPSSSYGSQPYGGQPQGGYGGQQHQGGYGGQPQGGYGGQQHQGGYGGQPQGGYGGQQQGHGQGGFSRDAGNSGNQGQFPGGFMMPPGSGGN
ncbi:hypothetical protein DSO57_1034865 [Entomophthora muscae]|uniref:Uncharacterized protein n=1 Tax=Entomophthora muscae TaxID=34485 RepID=A0ACC2UAH1_9FUNG|nr:hypothetical protein DSO57_1034865 [Entomophthora muscae]